MASRSPSTGTSCLALALWGAAFWGAGLLLLLTALGLVPGSQAFWGGTVPPWWLGVPLSLLFTWIGGAILGMALLRSELSDEEAARYWRTVGVVGMVLFAIPLHGWLFSGEPAQSSGLEIGPLVLPLPGSLDALLARVAVGLLLLALDSVLIAALFGQVRFVSPLREDEEEDGPPAG